LDAKAGDDRVDALIGGFGGGGLIKLGSGDDQAYGFGDIRIDGGSGHDRVFLPGLASDYLVVKSQAATSFSSGAIKMVITNIEEYQFLG
jgi:hypothetical protein